MLEKTTIHSKTKKKGKVGKRKATIIKDNLDLGEMDMDGIVSSEEE